MFFREAKSQDIPKIAALRLPESESSFIVAEPGSAADYEEILGRRGKGWVCEVNGDILGYALVDTKETRVRALFVRPGEESKFIRRMLHDMMVSWCFARAVPKLFLHLPPGAAAEKFYQQAGWISLGSATDGTIHLEMENNLEPL